MKEQQDVDLRWLVTYHTTESLLRNLSARTI